MTAGPGARERYSGRIAGLGTTSGTRLVVGHWTHTSLGPFSDVMAERSDGHRILLAPNQAVCNLIEATYNFDEVRLEPVTVDEAGIFWHVLSPSLSLSLEIGGRSAVGWLLHGVPPRLATSTTWATLVDPVARRVLDGVRTYGTAKEGRREWYGATDVRRVVAASGTFDGELLGALAPVDPPCRFGFSSTPRSPSVTSVVTTIETLP